MNYTKGEWQVKVDNGSKDFGGKVGIITTTEKGSLNIAYKIGPNMSYNHPENLANAHLIAASPQMYEALENLVFYMQQDGVPWSQLKTEVEKARLVLAKAEGK